MNTSRHGSNEKRSEPGDRHPKTATSTTAAVVAVIHTGMPVTKNGATTTHTAVATRNSSRSGTASGTGTW